MAIHSILWDRLVARYVALVRLNDPYLLSLRFLADVLVLAPLLIVPPSVVVLVLQALFGILAAEADFNGFGFRFAAVYVQEFL